MDYGTLRVAMPDGQVLEHVIDSPSVFVGRADTNRIVIDHVSVSRRHARLTIESGRLMVEDLGSAAGTFVGGTRLTPNRPGLAEDGQPLRFGEIEARFALAGALRPAPPPLPSGAPVVGAASAATFQSQPTGAPQAIGVALKAPTEPVAAGSATTATVGIQNRGSTVDELTIAVTGPAAPWARVSRTQVSLLPGARDEVTIIIEPPQAASVRAGAHEFTVVVTSRQHGSEVRAPGTVTVLAFGGMEVRLEPVRSERNFRLVIENRGNAPLGCRLGATDDEEAIEFTFATEAVQVPPGESRTVPLQARLKARKLFGPPSVNAFRVEVTPGPPAASARPGVANGQLVRKPPLEAWKRPVLVLLLLAALGGGGFGYTRVCGSGWPLCPGGAESGQPANGGGLDGAGSPAPSASASASPAATGSASASASAAASASPSASASASPGVTTVPAEGPKILWIVADHAGSGAVSVRIATDVPTTATLSVYRTPARSRNTPVPTPAPVSDSRLSTLHTLAIGTFGVAAGFSVEVKDADGQPAYGALELDEPVAGYWTASGNPPALTISSGLKATVTWTLARADPASKLAVEALLFMKKAGCSTADACVGDLEKTFPATSKPSGNDADAYVAAISFPDNKHDYQVLLAGRSVFVSGPGQTTSSTQFYEITIPGSKLK